jgi:hypothetical protein
LIKIKTPLLKPVRNLFAISARESTPVDRNTVGSETIKEANPLQKSIIRTKTVKEVEEESHITQNGTNRSRATNPM